MKAYTLAVLIPFALLVACSRKEPPAAEPPVTPTVATPAEAAADGASVTLAGASGSNVTGELTLTASGSAVAIAGELSGLKPGGEHGFHVHEKGDCSAPDAKSAGEHFNPAMAPHGGPTQASRHLGDIPNIKANDSGIATVNAQITGATLRDGGTNDLVGKAVIVHAQRDDYTTQPSGNSGERIACGVVR